MALRKAMIIACALLLVCTWQMRIKQVNKPTPHQPEEMIMHARDCTVSKARKRMVEQDQEERADALVEQDVYTGQIFKVEEDVADEAVAALGEAFTVEGVPLDPSVETVATSAGAAGEDAVDVAEPTAEAELGAELVLDDEQGMKTNVEQDEDELAPVVPEKQKAQRLNPKRRQRQQAQQLAEAKGSKTREEHSTELWAAILHDDWTKAKKAAKEWAAERKTDALKHKDDTPAENKDSVELVGAPAVDTRPRYGEMLEEDEEELAKTAGPEADERERTPAVTEVQGSESPEEQNDEPTRVKKVAAERTANGDATHAEDKSRTKAKKTSPGTKKDRAQKDSTDEAAAGRAPAEKLAAKKMLDATERAAWKAEAWKRRQLRKSAAHGAAAKQEAAVAPAAAEQGADDAKGQWQEMQKTKEPVVFSES